MERRLAAVMVADVVGYSRMIRENEEGTIAALQQLHSELIDRKISEHRGRVVKLMGDGILAEFGSVVDAVNSANELQVSLAQHNTGLPQKQKIEFRIGINLGDVIIDGDDIQGDGVNVAARLESLAEPGGLCISRAVYEQIRDRVDLPFDNLGPQQLKNIDRPVHVYRRSPDRQSLHAGSGTAHPKSLEQEINFCTSPDGVQIAYATVGQGPPLVKTANWLNHLEYDWQSPAWHHLLAELSADHQLIRYDERGNGLSDWNVEDLSFETWVSDLECVVDDIGLEKFALFGVSQGCAVSIAYAVRHPERVTRLVLYGGYARGQQMRGTATDVEASNALLALMRQGWGRDNPAFRQINTALFMPDATPEQKQWFGDLQRVTTSPENAVRFWQEFDKTDVADLLSQVTVPTLVLHCRDEAAVPFAEGQRMARMIPGARFVALEGQNHFILDTDPGWPQFLDEVLSFLHEDIAASDPVPLPSDSGDTRVFPSLPDKPSIAVLPFDNMSGDPEQEYFSDGMTEDIITALSRFHQFFVIARNSSFSYRGRVVDVKQAAGELGVQYVMEGSVRKAGNRVRVTAQLIDGATGNHLWAERYDRGLDDIFAVQDEITAAIVAAIEPNISHQERERAQRTPPGSLDTWGQYQRGLAAYYATTEDGLAAAIEIFDRVNELEPQFQAAFAMAAEARVRYVMFYKPDDRTTMLAQAKEKAQRGISLEPGDPICLLAEGRVNVLLGHVDLALLQINEAIALNPNYAMAEYVLGWALFAAGRHEEAIPRLDNAIRLSPHDAFLSGFQHMRARALFALQRYEECIEWERRATRSPNAHYWAFVTLAAAFLKLDRRPEARDAVADLLQRAPHFSLRFLKNSGDASFNKEDPLDDAELIEGFRVAGVPE